MAAAAPSLPMKLTPETASPVSAMTTVQPETSTARPRTPDALPPRARPSGRGRAPPARGPAVLDLYARRAQRLYGAVDAVQVVGVQGRGGHAEAHGDVGGAAVGGHRTDVRRPRG